MRRLTRNGGPHMDLSGDQSAVLALNEVLSLRLPSFYRCAWRLLGNAADAEDAVQEALLAAYRHIDQFRGQAQIATWLTAIVRNCALMQLRKRNRQIHLSLDEPTGGEEQYFVWETIADTRPSPEEECRNFELFARLQEYAALLSPTLRRTFQLRVVDGLSILETARVVGLPHGTVKAQLARARRKVAQHMQRALEPGSRMPQRAYRPSRRRRVISIVD
jgi:RNA polymerase sigma-70 factor, ECF subfamily